MSDHNKELAKSAEEAFRKGYAAGEHYGLVKGFTNRASHNNPHG